MGGREKFPAGLEKPRNYQKCRLASLVRPAGSTLDFIWQKTTIMIHFSKGKRRFKYD